jgi:hypothetical protein
VTFVFFSKSFPCDGIWLAREASAKDINSSSVSCRVEFSDVSILFGVWEVVLEDFSREFFPLAIEEVLPTHPFGCEVKASDS